MRRRELARHTHMCPDYIKKKSSSLRNRSMVTHTLFTFAAMLRKWRGIFATSRPAPLPSISQSMCSTSRLALRLWLSSRWAFLGEGPASSSTSMPAWV